MRHIATLFCLPVLAVACHDGVGPGREPLVSVSGNAQRTLPGGQVPRPLVVRAVDSAGNPRAGVLIHWSGNTGSSFLTDTSRTGSDGRAYGVWVLGSTIGSYGATATPDSGVGRVNFDATADPKSLILNAVPDTIKFDALGDTLRVRVRVREVPPGTLDTILEANGAGGRINDPAQPTFVPFGGLVFKSVHNGSAVANVNFGTVGAFFTEIVGQVPVTRRIVLATAKDAAPDTLRLGPDTTLSLTVLSVDKHGYPVENDIAPDSLTWQSQDVSTVTIDANGVAHGISDGVSYVTAQFFPKGQAEVRIKVWTMHPAELAAGSGTTCAPLVDHTTACWGFRDIGANSLLNEALAPEVRPGFPAFNSIVIGDVNACGLTATGAAYCWGQSSNGQIGNGTVGAPLTATTPPTVVSSPTAVSGGLSFTSIAMGGVHACGLTAAGAAYCWGQAYGGFLGNGTYGDSCGKGGSCASTPRLVSGGLTFSQLAVGGGHACGITTDSHLYCWGDDRYGQLGSPRVPCLGYVGSTSTANYWCSTVPVEVTGGRLYKSVAASSVHTCAVTIDGVAYCWGNGMSDVLGIPGTDVINAINEAPLAVQTTQRFQAIYSGTSHTCAIDLANAAWCWGQDFAGQLGNGGNGSTQCTNGTCEVTPVQVAGGLSFKKLTMGASHTCGLTLDDVVYCWGAASTGAVGTGASGGYVTAPRRVAFQRR